MDTRTATDVSDTADTAGTAAAPVWDWWGPRLLTVTTPGADGPGGVAIQATFDTDGQIAVTALDPEQADTEAVRELAATVVEELTTYLAEAGPDTVRAHALDGIAAEIAWHREQAAPWFGRVKEARRRGEVRGVWQTADEQAALAECARLERVARVEQRSTFKGRQRGRARLAESATIPGAVHVAG